MLSLLQQALTVGCSRAGAAAHPRNPGSLRAARVALECPGNTARASHTPHREGLRVRVFGGFLSGHSADQGFEAPTLRFWWSQQCSDIPRSNGP